MKMKELSEYKLQNPKNALQALQAPLPSIVKMKHEYGIQNLQKKCLFPILSTLFSVRFSKHVFSPVMLTEFTDWLLTNYYFLKLPEIELALMDYRGQVFQVIDLEALKIMIEDFDMKRCQAVEESKPATDELKKGDPMPESLKRFGDLLKAKRLPDKLPMPKTLEELFEKQGFKGDYNDPETGQIRNSIKETSERLRDEWKEEYGLIEGEKEHLETFMRSKETYFIFNSYRNFKGGK